MHFKRSILFFIIFVIVLGASSYAQETHSDSIPRWGIAYGPKGILFTAPDDAFSLHIQSRLQFRFATPGDNDPVSFNDFNDSENTVLKINRARLKVGGHAYKPWLKYYWEYELGQGNLLDFRIMIERFKWLNVKVGQWKVEFTRERRISSGTQQLVDRSILNRNFTIDRQQGIELYGRLEGRGLADFSYWAAVLTGSGRGATENDDKNLMYFGRLQWNILGDALGFGGSSDLEIHQKPEAQLAFSAVTNRSPFTRFSSSGGGSLNGFEEQQPGQYRINQRNFETAFKYKGFSWQSELHYKEIIDKLNADATTQLRGFYAQAGYFGHQALHRWPRQLELAARYAEYSPNIDQEVNLDEISVALNWFFKGHRNKLTAEISNFDYESELQKIKEDWRFRVQWEISF
ncbi:MULTISPECIES: porin [unclassified Leeuwenhoekiella]|uniref:porin n=1 Tax=unclassified Leeuwenhoekiella TaxID=2615029 RepID=UPI000C498800|nr:MULTISPECIES: porin [unclassified Leeuwenhoekiella]MAW97037.1 porin [Leeuwenhoekiella sp.]MBA80682.1 porin [Leeuwenhoekiella sp.]|tara:strand:- start:52136 stop:53344 length:1209 start_codon:yes stop_codon:yes gene_type:complete